MPKSMGVYMDLSAEAALNWLREYFRRRNIILSDSAIISGALQQYAKDMDWFEKNPPLCPKCNFLLVWGDPQCPKCGTPLKWAPGEK
jgi:hypothetical protein